MRQASFVALALVVLCWQDLKLLFVIFRPDKYIWFWFRWLRACLRVEKGALLKLNFLTNFKLGWEPEEAGPCHTKLPFCLLGPWARKNLAQISFTCLAKWVHAKSNKAISAIRYFSACVLMWKEKNKRERKKAGRWTLLNPACHIPSCVPAY